MVWNTNMVWNTKNLRIYKICAPINISELKKYQDKIKLEDEYITDNDETDIKWHQTAPENT